MLPHPFHKGHRSSHSLLLSEAASGNPLSAYSLRSSCFLLILLYTHQHLPRFLRFYLLYQVLLRLLPGILPDSAVPSFCSHPFHKGHRSYHPLLLSAAVSGSQLSAYNLRSSCFLPILLYTHQHLPRYLQSYLQYPEPLRLLPGILPDSAAPLLLPHPFHKEHRSYHPLLLSAAVSGSQLSAYNLRSSCFLPILLYTHQHLPRYLQSYLQYPEPLRLLPGILPDSAAPLLLPHPFHKEHRSYHPLLLSAAVSGSQLSAYSLESSYFLPILLYTHQHLPRFLRSYLLYQVPLRLLPYILPDSAVPLFLLHSFSIEQIKKHSYMA